MGGDGKWVVVGVSGVTCGGKTTFSVALQAAFPGSIILSQDDYFLPPDDKRHTHIPRLNHINWEIASALDMNKMISDIQEILSRPISEIKLPLLIIEGFLIFTDQFISSICDHKLFFTLTPEECQARRCARTYDPPDPSWAAAWNDIPGYFEQVVWPEYERHLQIALDINKDLKLIPGTRDTQSVVEDLVVVLSSDLKFDQ